MGLTSSLYSGVSGLTTLGNSMQIIGDNIANVNTIGYKGSSYAFQDLLSQVTATMSGTAQMGRGTGLGDIYATFEQGSFESTGNTTDLAIGGDGFFILRESDSEQNFYTRAGNFRFDKDGYMVNPEGYVVQGWELDENGEDIGSVKDIVMLSFTSPPEASDQITMVTNLDSREESQTPVLQNMWDSSETTPMESSNYEYQSTVKVYDALGNTHDITIYYDKLEGSKWEYLVTCNPEEDLRNGVQNTNSKGLLARGYITFNEASGRIEDISMARFTGRIGNIRSFGSISDDDIAFTIDNYDAMPYDGLDFQLEFDGSEWNWKDLTVPPDGYDPTDLPENYQSPEADILTEQSSASKIVLDLNGDSEGDLTINLRQPALALDAIYFDINDPDDLHVQNVVNTSYSGDAGNDNTTLTINNYTVMDVNEEDIGVNWDAYNEIWMWSNPTVQNVIGTDTSNYTGTLQLTADGNDATVQDPEIMTEYIDDLRLDWRRDIDESTVTFSGDSAGNDTRITSTNGTLITHDYDAITNALAAPLGAAAYPRSYELQFTGAGWVETGANTIVGGDYPAAATITPVGANGEYGFQIDLDNDGDVDIESIFEHPLDTNALGDDIGESVAFQVQDTHWAWNHPDVVNDTYTGDASNNTTMEILNSNALSTTMANIRMDFNDKTSGTGRWYWNRPETFGVNSTLNPTATRFLEDTMTTTGGIKDLDTVGELAIDFPTFSDGNPAMTEYSKDVRLEWVQTQAYSVGADTIAGTADDVAAMGTFRWAIAGRPVNSPPAEYPNATFTVTYAGAGAGEGQPTGVNIDLDNDGVDDMTLDFTALGGTGLASSGTIEFDIDPLSSTAPTQYSSAQIVTNTSSELAVDLDGDDKEDIVWEFDDQLSKESTITFDILTNANTPPREYSSAVIDPLADENNLLIDLNDDGTNNIQFTFDPATTNPDTIGYLTFDIDPRIAPEKYPDAEIESASDESTLLINLDGDIGDDTTDITFAFTESLNRDSSINFGIEGTTAWNELETSDLSNNGYYEFVADFLGGEVSVENNQFNDTTQKIEFNIGSSYDFESAWVNDSLATTQYARASSTTYQSATGYGAGDLENVFVDTDGIITGAYSNGELIPIYRVALAKFLNNQALYREGSNLFSETRGSGDAITGIAGTNGLGSIAPNSLEQSNVDIANEFVKMISTQRGFQANSKIVTTVDTMLSDVINMKR